MMKKADKIDSMTLAELEIQQKELQQLIAKLKQAEAQSQKQADEAKVVEINKAIAEHDKIILKSLREIERLIDSAPENEYISYSLYYGSISAEYDSSEQSWSPSSH